MKEVQETGLSRRTFLREAGVAAAGAGALSRSFGRARAAGSKPVPPAAGGDGKQPDAAAPACPEPKEIPVRMRFTTRARRVVFHAQEEAAHLNAEKVGPEHLLLALAREPDSAGAETLQRLGLSLSDVREEILQQVTPGAGAAGQELQLTPTAKRVIDYAFDEARGLPTECVGSEHLLLGLLRENDELAAGALTKRGVDLDRARREAILVQSQDERAGCAVVLLRTHPPVVGQLGRR